MNIKLVMFIVAAVLIIAFGTFNFFSGGRTISAILFLIGSILVFVFFGKRWFDDNNLFNRSPGEWPPTINSCPDFLTFYKRKLPDGSVADSCIDRVGVSRNNMIQKFPTDGATNPPDSESYYFPLKTSSNDPDRQRAELCQRTIQYGLTWEGVSDGETCFSAKGTGEPVVPTAETSCPQ
jgi:hypothetical protein